MKALGIDPGTSRWAFVFLEGGAIVEEKTILTEEIKKNPSLALDIAKRAQVVVGPSGYGTALKKVADLTENDFFEIFLKRRDEKPVIGLEAVLRAFKMGSLNAYVVPGVKLLPTVSVDKKQGRIDMGTPDKLCAAVAGIVDQARRAHLRYDQTDFILAEIGFGFDAFLLVEGGQVVNGIGGTMSSSRWEGTDGEMLYLTGRVGKEELMKGGLPLEKVQEGALKDINGLAGRTKPREILLSGSRSGYVYEFLTRNFKNVRLLKTCESSNAAYGAAVIADGLAGGRFKEVVELLGIKDAKGSNLDYTGLEFKSLK